MNSMTIVNEGGRDDRAILTTMGPELPPNVIPNPIIIHDNNRSGQQPAPLSDRFTSTPVHETAEWKEKQKKFRRENAEIHRLRLEIQEINAENESLKIQIEKVLYKSLPSG